MTTQGRDELAMDMLPTAVGPPPSSPTIQACVLEAVWKYMTQEAEIKPALKLGIPKNWTV